MQTSHKQRISGEAVRNNWSDKSDIPENVALGLIAASLLLATIVFFSVYNLLTLILNDYVIAFGSALLLSSVVLRCFPDMALSHWK